MAQLAAERGASIDPLDGSQARTFLEGLIRERRARGEGLHLRRRARPDLGGGVERLVHPPGVRTLASPRFLTERPDSFPPISAGEPWTAPTPAVSTLTLRGGYLGLVADAPVVFAADRSVIRPYSSGYNGLALFYDRPIDPILDAAVEIDGRAIVLIDDVWEANYCHWLADWLPRPALTPGGDDLHAVVSPLAEPWQRETLRACGFSDERIVAIHPWQAVGARELIAPSHLTDILHPAFKGSDWATAFLRSHLLRPEATSLAPQRRLLVSRQDARWRRLLNEDALAEALAPHGFERVRLTGLGVADQAELFASAAVVVAPHGAGLTNIVFSQPGARLLEIFPRTHGTPAFWVLAASSGVDYAAYVTSQVSGSRGPAFDDLSVDVADFMRRSLPFLTQGAARED